MSQIRMPRERMLARYTKIGTRWRHKRKKHEDASPLFCFRTVMPGAIISGSVNALTMKALMTFYDASSILSQSNGIQSAFDGLIAKSI